MHQDQSVGTKRSGKWYARMVPTATINTRILAEIIQRNCTVKKSDVMAVIECTAEPTLLCTLLDFADDAEADTRQATDLSKDNRDWYLFHNNLNSIESGIASLINSDSNEDT